MFFIPVMDLWSVLFRGVGGFGLSASGLPVENHEKKEDTERFPVSRGEIFGDVFLVMDGLEDANPLPGPEAPKIPIPVPKSSDFRGDLLGGSVFRGDAEDLRLAGAVGSAGFRVNAGVVVDVIVDVDVDVVVVDVVVVVGGAVEGLVGIVAVVVVDVFFGVRSNVTVDRLDGVFLEEACFFGVGKGEKMTSTSDSELSSVEG